MIQQINANYGSKKNRDTVELSQKALELLAQSEGRVAAALERGGSHGSSEM